MAEFAEESFEIVIKGSAPYGFRLYGGEGDPLIIAKLRARSKGHDAGMREGDVVLGINGRSCQAMSHGTAMGLLETARGDELRLHLYRGSNDRKSLSAAYSALGSQLRPLSPGAAAPIRPTLDIQPSPSTGVEPSAQPPVAEGPATAETSKDDEPVTSYSRQEVTSSEPDASQRTAAETRDPDGVALSRVTPVAVEGPDGGGATSEPTGAGSDRRSTLFHVSKVKGQPLRWIPQGSAASGQFQARNSLTAELEDKENLTPKKDFGESGKFPGEPPKFKVFKTTGKRCVWQPGSAPGAEVPEPSPPVTFEVRKIREFRSEQKPEEGFPRGSLDDQLEGTERRGRSDLSPRLFQGPTTEGTHEVFSLGRERSSILSSTDQSLEGPAPRSQPTRQHKAPHNRPTPWNTQQTEQVGKAVSGPIKETLEGYPEDPEASSAAFAKNRALFEKGAESQPRDREPPWKRAMFSSRQASQLCDLKGKGAKLFAQRRAKALEEEAERSREGEATGLKGRSEESKNETPQPTDAQETSVRSIEEPVSISKVYPSPWESKGVSETIPTPWQTSVPVSDADKRAIEGGSDDTWRQKITDDIPTFIAKKAPSGSYRPVKFLVPSSHSGFGTTDF